MSENGKCFICEEMCEYNGGEGDYGIHRCAFCGVYVIDAYASTPGTYVKLGLPTYPDEKFESSKLKLRQMMYFYLKHRCANERRTVFFRSSERQSDDRYHYVQYETLMNLYPRNFTERIDMILMNLSLYGLTGELPKLPRESLLKNDAEREKAVNARAIEFLLEVNNLSENDKEAALRSMIGHLHELGYLKNNAMSGNSISAKGWLRIQELESQYKVIPQGFVAMWFDEKMKLAGEKILGAIKDNGYSPVRIDMKEHNNQIVPEIFYEIKRSQFVVADLTGHRNGVYYEAGYAQALNKQVIFTCRAADFGEKHFDVAQQNIIRWENEEDLYEKLKKRIEATVGKK